MKSQRGQAQTALPDDWDFSAVAGCCLWEYARESAFIRDTMHRYREWFLSGAMRDAASDALSGNMAKIQSMGDVSGVFLRGCTRPEVAFHPTCTEGAFHLPLPGNGTGME